MESPHPERPSCWSSGCPWFFVPEDGVEDGHELAHAGDDGELGGLSGGAQAMIGVGQRQLAPDPSQHAHVEGGAYDGPSAGDGTAPSQGSTVAIKRGNAGQRSGLPAVEAAQFGQLGDQGTGDPGPNPWNTDQEVLGLAPGRGSAHGNVDVVVDLFELGLQGGEHAIDALQGAPHCEHAPAIALGADHLDELAPAGHQLTEQPGLRIGEGPGRRLHRLGEVGNDGGIQGIGLGQPCGGPGEVSDLSRIDHGHRQAGRGQTRRDDKAGCPSFETHRFAMLLRMRYYNFTFPETALAASNDARLESRAPSYSTATPACSATRRTSWVNSSRRRRTVGRSWALAARSTASAIWRSDAAPIMPEAPFSRCAARAMTMKSSVSLISRSATRAV